MDITNHTLLTFSQNALLKIGEEKLAQQCQVYWNPRMRSTAGRAKLDTLTVEINPLLIEHGEQEVYTTVLHELAHLLAWQRYKHKGHGLEWRLACAELGIPNEAVTHTLPLPSRRQKKNWRYKCPHCKEQFDRVRRIKKPSACALCCKTHNRGKYTTNFLK